MGKMSDEGVTGGAIIVTQGSSTHMQTKVAIRGRVQGAEGEEKKG